MSDRFKNIAKKGWHPEKPGSSLRGQVSGLVHRDKKNDEASTHTAVPISQLKDPSTFAPPPKRTGSGLAPPPPVSTEPRKVITAPSKYQDTRGDQVSGPAKISETPEQAEYWAQRAKEREPQEEEPVPKGPYRTNTTGLSTDHLPPPPGRKDGANVRSPPPPAPPSYESATSRPVPVKPAALAPATSSPAPAKPSLPPRLPPRTNSGGSSSPTPSNNSSASNLLNQSSINRLGRAGVSVPGLGIGSGNQQQAAAVTTTRASPPPPPRPSSSTPTSPPPPPRQRAASQVNELQNRFSRLRTGSTPQQPAQSQQQQQQQAPAEGTTWAQKQAALKTASDFHKDPSTVSLSDAKSAAGTANNFRQRHGEQVASGVKTANTFNQKYGVANKIGGLMGSGQQQPDGQDSQVQPGTMPGVGMASGGLASSALVAGKKKPPPPPPKKKPGLQGNPAQVPAAGADAPPPVPLATRPTF